MEESPSIPTERTSKIVRRSIFIFLKHYQHFTTIAALFIFPVSVSILLSQAVLPSLSPLLPTIQARLQSLFDAAGFPPSSQLFSLLSLKLSQTICSSIVTIPFTLSFLLVAKACVIRGFNHCKPSPPASIFSLAFLYSRLFFTYINNCFVILAANATTFSLFFLAFNSFAAFGFSSPNFLLFLSAAGAILYSVILANTFIICNLALVVAGMENCSGYLAILKAFVLLRGRTSIALSLALPVNLGLAAIEALFQYRVVRDYHLSVKFRPSMALEGLLIAYLYSLLVLLDTIASCIFFKACKSSCQKSLEGSHNYQIDLAQEEDKSIFTIRKTLQEFP
ncbi:PREDICTED: uncharacterized protein LOC104598335 [Nelumbo nucifera]|uniref:Uncharacterized protein LOC104598335 n=2 Tax=Nelumbo nucifera TaxID=4432 RepID=A0A1U7ZXW4_NELNU|nr:PREDICTED: uncharacterized protein LOC104598335 [Nelumbo nucifera]DAD34956.1 TPA_asm: hypothetical protein HUJ06_005596 [Nelumbo nucifera]